MLAKIAGNAAPGGAAYARTYLLNYDHQGKAEESEPTEIVAKSCARLAVGRNGGWIVIGGAADEPGA
jgi:hypothetical protein